MIDRASRPQMVTIIGSGISSLTSAIILLRAGYKVRVLEQHYLAGGYLHCFKRFGHQYDTGGHYVGAMEKGLPFYKLLNYLGVYSEDDYIELNRNAVDRYHFKDHQFTYVSGYQNNINNLSKLFPNESDQINSFFERVHESAQSFPTFYFKSSFDQGSVLKNLELTLGEVLSEYDFSSKLKEILIAPCILHGVAADEVSFGIHSILIDSLIVSSHGFQKGAKVLAKKFVDKIEDLGGEVLLKTKVVDIKVSDDKVNKIIASDGREFISDFFIAGIHPKLIFNMIGAEKLKKSYRTRLNKIKESKPFIGAYLLLKSNPGIDPLSNYYFYKVNAEEVFKSEENDRGDAVFFTCPNRMFTGEGHFPLTIHASCSDDTFAKWNRIGNEKLGNSYEKMKEEIWCSTFDLIEEHLPGFRDSIIKSEFSTPLTNKFFNPSVNGSAYGIYHDQSSTGVRSLGPRTHFKNLLLTGQNTLFPGILGAAISGLRTSGHFVGLKGILKELEKQN